MACLIGCLHLAGILACLWELSLCAGFLPPAEWRTNHWLSTAQTARMTNASSSPIGGAAEGRAGADMAAILRMPGGPPIPAYGNESV